MRVFVNQRPADVPEGCDIAAALRAVDPSLADAVQSGHAYVTDGVGRRVEGTTQLHEGAILRVVRTVQREEARNGEGEAGVLSRAALQALPKAELHVHLDGSLRPETMLELAREQGIRLPADDPQGLAAAMRVQAVRSLEEYLERFAVTLSVMQTAAALERIAYELVLDSAADGVRYLEVRYCPALHRPALTLTQAVEAPLAGLKRGEAETGTVARLIVCGLRTLAPAVSVELAHLAVAYARDGVVGFDLAGAERGHPAADHAAAFEYARGHGLACTCHAGEADGPASIRQAIEICGAIRIGHGTRLHEDPALEEEVAARQIPLEVCLSSNVHTRAVSRLEAHPVRRYVERGMRVTLNTDSRLLDATTLSDELWLAQTRVGLGPGAIRRIVANGFESAFLSGAAEPSLLARLTGGAS